MADYIVGVLGTLYILAGALKTLGVQKMKNDFQNKFGLPIWLLRLIGVAEFLFVGPVFVLYAFHLYDVTSSLASVDEPLPCVPFCNSSSLSLYGVALALSLNLMGGAFATHSLRDGPQNGAPALVFAAGTVRAALQYGFSQEHIALELAKGVAVMAVLTCFVFPNPLSSSKYSKKKQ